VARPSRPTIAEASAAEPLAGERGRGGRGGRPRQSSQPAQSADAKKNRRVRRRKKRENEDRTPPKRYETVLELDFYDLIRDCVTAVYYIGWYDPRARQMRRRSLQTTVARDASDIADRVDASGITGDPLALLQARIDIEKVLRDYQAAHAHGASAEFNRIAIDKHLIPALGHIRIDDWRTEDFAKFERAFGKKYSKGYLSRICAVLRAALVNAEKAEKIARAPRIPEVSTDDDRDSAPLKGRVATTEEIAKLIDAVSEPHFLEYLIACINSAGRPITILESDTTQIDWKFGIFETNPRGRSQTKKYRPTIRIAATWRPWLRKAPPGHLITYRGKPVKSVKAAFRRARKTASLKADAAGVPVTSYSIRHTIGRFMESCDVPSIERSILLGHVKTYRKKSTERYSPLNPRGPNFLKSATRAIEKFVREINSHTKKWNLLVPYTLKAGYKPSSLREKKALGRAKRRGVGSDDR
jgi:hypothetical protein